MDASSIKPNEQYPKQKLLEIDKLLASLEVVNQKELRYKELVDKADKQFVAKDYFNSKNSYSQAMVIKQDVYPKQKIEEMLFSLIYDIFFKYILAKGTFSSKV